MLRDDKAAEAVVATYQAAAPAPLLGSPASSEGKGKAGGAESDMEAGLAGEESGLEGGTGKPALARTASDAAALLEEERPQVSFAYQTHVLSVRMLRNWGRSPLMLAAEAVQVREQGGHGGQGRGVPALSAELLLSALSQLLVGVQ